jgi:riboflavin biosynthesis pyrimidine reductase
MRHGSLSAVTDSAADLPSLELLFERPELPRFELPRPLLAGYGGSLGFSRPRSFANLVASLDGVVALPKGGESGQIVSGNSKPDRFVMGLLRACADAVIVGAGTFRKSPGHLWHPGVIFPPAAALFAEARKALGLSPLPTLVLITASGEIDTEQPAAREALFVTGRSGEATLRARAPSARIAVLGSDEVRFSEVFALLRAQGLELLLTEGGPTLLAELVAEEVLDELFLTSSPRLFGRYAGDQRKSLSDGLDLGGVPLELSSVRRHESHLFLRYAFTREG